MKTILSLILLSLFVYTAYTAEGLTVSEVGSSKGNNSVLIYKCIGDVDIASGDSITHKFQYKVGSGTYSDIDATKMFMIEGPQTSGTGKKAYAHLLVAPGKFSASDSVTIQCQSTWTGTTANNAAYTPIASATAVVASNASALTISPSLNNAQTQLKFALSTVNGTDTFQYIYAGLDLTTYSSNIDSSNIAAGTLIYVIGKPSGSADSQVLLVHTFNKFNPTASASTKNCIVQNPKFVIPKLTGFSKSAVVLTLSDGTNPVTDSTAYVVTSDNSNVTVQAYINNGKIGATKSGYTLTVDLTQKSDTATLGQNVIVYAIPTTDSDTACALASVTSTLAYSSSCSKMAITNSEALAIAALDSNTVTAGSQASTEFAIQSSKLLYTLTKGTETKFFWQDPSALKPCLVVTKTAGTKACEEAKFTCERKTGTAGTITYDWTYAPAINSFTLAADVEASSVSTQTIAATKLTAGTKYTLTCTSSLADVSESNGTIVEYTPTADACTSSPADDDDDDDNSSILGVLVIALLALVF